MLALGFDTFGVASTYWLSVCAGAAVTSLVVGSAVLYDQWRRHQHRLIEAKIAQIMANLQAVPDTRPLERRAHPRRWGNPTEVRLESPLCGDLHALVVNRSTGGLGIYADKEFPPGTPVQVRAVEAPAYVPAVRAEVRHCLKVGKGFFLGCQFSEDVPWNASAWFG